MSYYRKIKLISALHKVISDPLLEVAAGLSSILYHFAGFNNALYNVTHNVFKLSKPEKLSREI